MYLCNDDHEEVCYEGVMCPVCWLRDEKDRAIEELEARVEELETE